MWGKKMCNEQYGRYRNHGMQCWRHFLTKDEKIEMLEEYKKWLEKETKGVEERIKELNKAS
jgi:hypothetical protein